MNDSVPFSELGLSKPILDSVQRMGFSSPTPVQEQAIPEILKGRDIVAAAKTGTGKTAAFSLPAMNMLARSEHKKSPVMLVITPTRELAQQIGETCVTIAKYTHHRVLTVVGGLSYDPQKKALSKGVDVLIATPGRLIDLMDQKVVRLDSVKILVLDEADRMLDMGFWPSVKKIVDATPKDRQTLLFSATIDKTISSSIKDMMKDPAFIEIAHKGETADTIDQYKIATTPRTKAALLKALIDEKGGSKVIVFTRTKSRADSTTKRLKRAGFLAEAIHSDKTQAQRKRALDGFSKGKTNILVATDVLARGIDVSEVDYVVNYDLPNQPEDYVHRIGRTGRAGISGFSVSLVSPEQEPWLKDIEKLIGIDIPTLTLKDYDESAAEEEAAQKATRYNAKRDPELAAAAKEHAKAKKNRKKKQEQQKAEPSTPRARKQKSKQKDQVQSSQKAPKKNASKNDMRPGRSHRAAVAKKKKYKS